MGRPRCGTPAWCSSCPWVSRAIPSLRGVANPIPWLLQLLLLTVGLPFFVIGTSAPVIQSWFAATGYRGAQDPYLLYGASNLGRIAALLGYPLVIEPHLRLADQGRLWAGGYGILVVLVALCATLLWRAAVRRSVPERPVAASTPADAELPLGRRLRWLALAFVPSSLMLGVTTYLTTARPPRAG